MIPLSLQSLTGLRHRVAGRLAVLLLLILLSACSSGDHEPQPQSLATPPLLASGHADAPQAPLPAALLYRFQPRQLDGSPAAYTRAAALPLDASASVLPGRSPIYLGDFPETSASQDGRLLAVAAQASGTLRFLDLAAWREAGKVEAVPGLHLAAWSGDGSSVYAWRDYCPVQALEGRCQTSWQREVWRIDVPLLSASRLAALDFSILALHVAPAAPGDGLYAYALGLRTDVCCGIDAKGDPFVAVIDLRRGAVVSEIALPGLLAGQPRYWLGDESVYASFSPATVLDSAGRRLYVVDSVDFRITVIDIPSRSVERSVDLGEPRSRLARMRRWLWSQLVGTAEAKGGPAYSRRAALTPDGRYLLISGTVALETSRDGARAWEYRPAGFVAVDTRTMKVVLRDETASAFQLSPDGRFLLTTGSYWEEDAAVLDGLVAFGLKLYDLGDRRFIAHVWPREDARIAGFAADGRHAFVVKDAPALAAMRRDGPPCRDACYELHVIEVESGLSIATRLLAWDESVVALAPTR